MNKPKVYLTDHNLNRIVSAAAVKGSGGQAVPANTLLDGPAICYGILRGCGDIIRRAHNIGHPYFHIDHGYLKRVNWNDSTSYSGYFRVSKNGLSLKDNAIDPCNKRLRQLNIELKPYNTNGRNIIVCGLTENFAKNHPYLKLDAKEWEEDVVKYLSSITDRPIIIKNKDGKPLDFRDAYLVVVHSSNAAIEALINGIGVLVLGESICSPISSFEVIGREWWNLMRYEILCNAANNQFTLEELTKPETWELLGVHDV